MDIFGIYLKKLVQNWIKTAKGFEKFMQNGQCVGIYTLKKNWRLMEASHAKP